MSSRFAVLAAVLAAVAPASAGAVVKTTILPVRSPIGTVAVTGVGQVDVTPNIARVTLSFADQKLLPAAAPLAEVPPEVRAQNLLALKEAHAQRVAPILQTVEGIVSGKKFIQGRDVRSDQSSRPEIEYVTTEDEQGDTKTQKSLFKGHSITTTIQVTLRGSKKSIEGRLSRLFDSVQSESQPQAYYEVAPRRQAAAERTALRRAFKDAEGKAQAQLKPYERLGHAIQRGDKQQPESPYGGGRSRSAKTAAAFAESADAGAGTPSIARIGSQTVDAQTHVVFEVLPGYTPRPPVPPRPPIRPLRRAARGSGK